MFYTIYSPDGVFDQEDNDGILTGAANQVDFWTLQDGTNNFGEEVKLKHQEFTDYFVSSDGKVPWQCRLI